MRKITYLIILQAIFTCPSVQAGTFLPTDDTVIDEWSPTTIYGTQQYLIVRNMNLPGFELDTLLKFNLSSLPTGAFINSAKLNLYYYHYNDANPSGNPLNVNRITSTWSESTTNWNNRPTYDPTATSTVSGPGSYGWVQWNVRSDVQDFVKGTKTNYGWQIMDASASSNSMIYFYPKEYTDSNYRPYLEVEYGTIYVDVNAAGSNNGTSWTNAFNKLQDALAVAAQGVKIWVARGTYKPDQGGGKTLGDRTATFQLINGVSIYGGFAGGETTLGQRNWQNNLTILSGDIGTVGSNSDNSYHILTGANGALLDGFIIRDGNANSTNPNNYGSGIYNISASPTLANCTFIANSAVDYGGAMFNMDDSNPVITDCAFTNNSSNCGGAIYNYTSDPVLTGCIINENSAQLGGGIYNEYGSISRIIRCTFTANTSTNMGGAIMNSMGSAKLINCILNDNTSQYGGGICNFESSPLITNCIFIDNSVITYGGGIFNFQDSNPILTNCSFNANSAGASGGGIFNLPGPPDCSPVLANCILWGNSDSSGTGQAAQIYSGTPVVTYSCIQDNDPNNTSIPFGGAANHNIGKTPLFRDAASGNLRLTGNSPCIEAGSNAAVPADAFDLDADGNTSEPTPFDLDNRSRFSDGDCDGNAVVDMGAYELIWVYLGDLNGDCSVNFLDFDIMADNWLAGK